MLIDNVQGGWKQHQPFLDDEKIGRKQKLELQDFDEIRAILMPWNIRGLKSDAIYLLFFHPLTLTGV